MSENSSFQKGTARKIFTPLVTLVIFLFIVTAPFSTDPFAFSPLGSLVFCGIALFLLLKLLRLLHHMKKHTWTVGAMVALFLSFLQVSFVNADFGETSQPRPVPTWQKASTNLSLMNNPSAWKASLDVDFSRGLPGISPLFYRPIVEGYPTTLIAIPGSTPDAFEPVALVTNHQVVTFAESPPILNTIPPNSLPIKNIVFLQPQTNSSAQPQFPDPRFLQANCMTCWSEVQLNANPDYIEKMVWDGASLVLGFFPVGRVGKLAINAGDLFALGSVANSFANQKWQAAGATTLGLGASKGAESFLTNFMGDDNPLANIGSWAFGKSVEQNLTSNLPPDFDYSWQVIHSTGGTMGLYNNMSLTWRTQTIDTYHGTFLNDGWTTTQVFKYDLTTVPANDLLTQSPLFNNNLTVQPLDIRPLTNMDFNMPNINVPPVQPSDIRPLNDMDFNTPNINVPPVQPTDIRPLNDMDFNMPNINLPSVQPLDIQPLDFNMPNTSFQPIDVPSALTP